MTFSSPKLICVEDSTEKFKSKGAVKNIGDLGGWLKRRLEARQEQQTKPEDHCVARGHPERDG